MKAGVLAVAAAMATGVMGKHARRHNHEAFHLEQRNYPISSKAAVTGTGAPETCGCTTIYTTITGEGTLYNPPPTYTSMKPKPTSTVVVVPTPFATTCPTPGVYTIPATTITLTKSTTVCGATSTPVTSGTYTAGGVTTVVETATTVICPYATTSTSEGVVTSTILTTTYVCPSAGTYTIAPLTTTVSTSTIWVYPTAASYPPGTYTQPEVVTTITKTNVVVVCPYTSSTPAPPAPTYAAPPAPTYVASPPPAKPTTSFPTSPSKPGLGSSAGKWAMTYSPYQDDEQCKDAGMVDYDISVIKAKGFSAVRVYSTDCSGLENIGAACEKYGLKMIIGVFINSAGCSAAGEQVTAITNWGKWSLVELIVVGNEAVFNGYATAEELAGFVSSSKQAFSSAGYSGPSTTTEPLDVWQANAGALCGAVDVVGCNIHPFFNPSLSSGDAGAFVKSQLDIVDTLCPGKTGVNLETGWPSAGTCNGNACPNPADQAIAVASIQAAAGEKSVMFSYVDDKWKQPGAFGCEQSWGSIHLFN